MLSSAARARLAVVLVGARNPQNIGAAARALQDFGFSDLRVVNEFTPPFEAAQLEATSAVGAHTVIAGARQFDALPEAIVDSTLVIGTTAIGGRELTRTVLTLQSAAPEILTALCSQSPEPPRVALLFGSEKTGLTNEQLSHCQLLLTIPLFDPISTGDAARHLSMNLGQSVAVCLYELTREGFEHSRELTEVQTTRATSEDQERLTQRLLELMQSTGYARRFPANAREPIVRALTQHLATTRDEAATWLGLFRHLLRTVNDEQ
jgi:tRNA (cytidine32/uridine32-2'-O)-methyltransferase